MPPTNQCAPGYLGMDPDVSFGHSYSFDWKLIRRDRVVIAEGTYVDPTRECCAWRWRVAHDLAVALKDPRLVVTECK